jgi:hypothetical protein
MAGPGVPVIAGWLLNVSVFSAQPLQLIGRMRPPESLSARFTFGTVSLRLALFTTPPVPLTVILMNVFFSESLSADSVVDVPKFVDDASSSVLASATT